jgi:hypothetical protein
MEDEGTTNFNPIKHRSIVSASGSNLVINISNLVINISNLVTQIILIIVGIIIAIIGTFLTVVKSGVIKLISCISLVVVGLLLCLGVLGIIIGIKPPPTLELSFQDQNLIVKKSGLIFSTDKEYLISKLDYIIIDQMPVENDEEGRENALSIGSEQNKISSKIIIKYIDIDEGFEEIFNGSGNPPLFTNDEVQFFNQFMKNNINRIKNES